VVVRNRLSAFDLRLALLDLVGASLRLPQILMNPLFKKISIVALVIGFSLAVSPARADDVSEKGREVFKRNQKAVVSVQIVLKATASGKSSESKREITGTVVDASGLTVLSLSDCDPAELYQMMMNDSNSQVETEITDIKILQDDGGEIPAEVVLRDRDLDLAFIRPKAKPANAMPAVDLTQRAQADVLEQLVAINRLNRAAGRAYSASIERVSAVIKSPRRFYIPDTTATATGLGAPAFSLDGKIVGFFVMRTIRGQSNSPRDFRQNLTGIIISADDVLKTAKQAPEAKGESADKKEDKEAK
jgi:S1-C subfamily serine protease